MDNIENLNNIIENNLKNYRKYKITNITKTSLDEVNIDKRAAITKAALIVSDAKYLVMDHYSDDPNLTEDKHNEAFQKAVSDIYPYSNSRRTFNDLAMFEKMAIPDTAGKIYSLIKGIDYIKKPKAGETVKFQPIDMIGINNPFTNKEDTNE